MMSLRRLTLGLALLGLAACGSINELDVDGGAGGDIGTGAGGKGLGGSSGAAGQLGVAGSAGVAGGSAGRGGAAGAAGTAGAAGRGGSNGVGGRGGSPGVGGRGGSTTGVAGSPGNGGSLGKGGTSGVAGTSGIAGSGPAGAPGGGGRGGGVAGGSGGGGPAGSPGTGGAGGSQGCFCTTLYDPVCGMDGHTYSNQCAASCANAMVAHAGTCEDCVKDADCTLWPMDGDSCCGSCTPAGSKRPVPIQCLVACANPLTGCLCKAGKCVGIGGGVLASPAE
jgi:hypothetical protein